MLYMFLTCMPNFIHFRLPSKKKKKKLIEKKKKQKKGKKLKKKKMEKWMEYFTELVVGIYYKW